MSTLALYASGKLLRFAADYGDYSVKKTEWSGVNCGALHGKAPNNSNNLLCRIMHLLAKVFAADFWTNLRFNNKSAEYFQGI